MPGVSHTAQYEALANWKSLDVPFELGLCWALDLTQVNRPQSSLPFCVHRETEKTLLVYYIERRETSAQERVRKKEREGGSRYCYTERGGKNRTFRVIETEMSRCGAREFSPLNRHRDMPLIYLSASRNIYFIKDFH